MRALITGMTGMAGSHLADYLIDNTDWNIVGLIRWRSPLENLARHIPAASAGKRIEFIYGDVRDVLAVDRAIAKAAPDYVFHLAAQSFPQVSFDSPIDTLDTNVGGTIHVLEAIRKRAPNAIVHICASSEIFGRVPRDQLPIGDDCRFYPASPYAISKVATDLFGRFYAEAHGLCVMTTRAFSHSGPRRGDVFAESSFAKQIAMIEAGLIPPVIKVGNLASVRTLADVRDIVRAYHMLLTINPVRGAYYNIGGSHTCTVGDILQALLALSPNRPEIRVEVDPARLRPLDADLQVPDCAKFKAHTGWEPTIPFERTMADLLEYWRERVKSDTVLQR